LIHLHENPDKNAILQKLLEEIHILKDFRRTIVPKYSRLSLEETEFWIRNIRFVLIKSAWAADARHLRINRRNWDTVIG